MHRQPRFKGDLSWGCPRFGLWDGDGCEGALGIPSPWCHCGVYSLSGHLGITLGWGQRCDGKSSEARRCSWSRGVQVWQPCRSHRLL